MTTIADIFELPERVHQGDFVLRLSEGVERAEQTLRDYVVTDQLARCFDDALSLIGSAMEANTSKGAYLHGSFGSGKSHFMAVLTLLLREDAVARSIPALAGAVAKSNAWTSGRRFLVVPYHMIGATSMESAILGRYADYVRAIHPEAPTPGFYQADHLFADARGLRARMGDPAFFRALNDAVRDESAGGGGGWGALGSGWDATSFDAALGAAPRDEERLRLVGDLIDAFYSAARTVDAADGERFVPLDEGLSVMSRHAQALGYDALILFLDELVLWLASHAADSAFVSREGQKVVKLVEATLSVRPIPIVSFIARQRDLRELVGAHLHGAGQLDFADVLNHWEARFDTITLEDRNLPQIVEHRVLRPKSPAARAELESAFERTERVHEEVLSTLLTRDGDRRMFRQVYPFTPALVQTLIAVSSLLQRERTALKLMLQLLVEQGHELQLGDIIPVGDLFDVIAEGDEPFTQAMKLRFDDARKLYRNKLLPLLESEHGVTAEEVKAGRVEPRKAASFRNDGRLMKTLLLSALADEVEALRALTPARLAALNHGTVRSPIPGQESQIVLTKCRQWATQAGEIKVSDDTASPVVALQIVGVDTESILENAKALDNPGYRIQKVRQLVYKDMELEESRDMLPQTFEMQWRGARRRCEILFLNVREMNPEDFRNHQGLWRIVIDWPFDEPPHTLSDDLAQVQAFQARGEPADTIVWLPWFFTDATKRDLGRLVLLDQVLTGKRLDEYGAHLSRNDRDQARSLLVNQRDQMRTRIRNCLLAAYGISRTGTDAVDDSPELEGHFTSLNPRVELRPPVAANIGDALRDVFGQALAACFPDHPKFGADVRRAGLRHVLEVVERAVSHPEQRVEVERQVRNEVRHIAEPLRLGKMGEVHFVLGRDWPDELDRKHAQHGGGTMNVRDLRAWIEVPEQRGLDRDVQNLLILVFALQKGLRFTQHGQPASVSIDKLDDRLVLETQALPDAREWERAVGLANEVFGIETSRLMNAQNVAGLTQALRGAADERPREAVSALTDSLKERMDARGIPPTTADRFRTASAANSLLAALDRSEDDALVATLAAADVQTSPAAMGQCLKNARGVAGALAAGEWQVFDRTDRLPAPYHERVREIATSLDDALRRDEHVTPFVGVLRGCQTRALDLLTEAATVPPPVPPQPPVPERPPRPDEPDRPDRVDPPAKTGHRTVAAAKVGTVFEEIENAAREMGATRVEIQWTIFSDGDDRTRQP